MGSRAPRRASSVAWLVALGLVLSPPVRAADPKQPEDFVCMSDEQLRTYLTYVALATMPEFLEFCMAKVRDQRDQEVEVEVTLLKYITAANPHIKRLRDQVTEIYRPTYGDKAREMTAKAREMEQDRASDFAHRSMGVSNCLNVIRNVRALTAEMTPDEPGSHVRAMVENYFPVSRERVARCAN